MFNFATLVPGVVSQNTGNAPLEQVSSFTVNGQRPNSNNMTIDGVANIDTGDNGGNMATTNIDAVAEFKILTNAYQAEYGRAVGGQVQVVTKSGTQSFHGSGYWYGRRSDWNANSWTNKRAAAPPPVGNGKLIEPPDSARNDYGYTLGGPIYIPGALQRGQEEALLLLEPGVPAPDGPGQPSGRPGCRPRSSGEGTSPRASTTTATPSPTSATTRPGCRAAPRTRAAASRTAGSSAGSRRTASTRRASPPSTSTPMPNFTAGSGINYTSQVPNESPRREDLLRLDFQPTDKWRFTGRYMKNKEDILQAYGTTWAGNGSDQPPACRSSSCTPAATGCSPPPAS